MSYIIIVRHGESEANVDSNKKKPKYQADALDSPLTKLGQKQATETGKFLKEYFNIKHIYCSPLLRCQQTANFINKEFDVKIEYDELLREFSNGELNGMTVKKFKTKPYAKKVEDIYDKFKQMMNKKILKKKDELEASALNEELNKLTGFETFKQAKVRTNKIIKKYVRKYNGDVLLCTHGGIILEVMSEYCNIYDLALPNNYGKYSNCNISVINMEERGRVDLIKYSKHLDKL